MEQSVGDRLDRLIKELGMNVNSFSQAIGVSGNSVIGRIVNDSTRAPSFALLQKIIERFPQVNVSWLITGQGEMLLSDNVAGRNYTKVAQECLAK